MHGIWRLRFLVRSSFPGALRNNNDGISGSAMMLLLRNLIMALCSAFLEVGRMLAEYSHLEVRSLYTDRSFSYLEGRAVGYSTIRYLQLLCWLLDLFLLESGLLRAPLRI